MECKTGFSNKQRLVLLGFTPNRLTERHQVSVCLSYIWCSHITCMEEAKAMMDYWALGGCGQKHTWNKKRTCMERERHKYLNSEIAHTLYNQVIFTVYNSLGLESYNDH